MASEHPDIMRVELGLRVESFRESFSAWIGPPLFGLFLIGIGGLFVWLAIQVYSPDIWGGNFNDPGGIWVSRISYPFLAILVAGFGMALIYNWFSGGGNDQLDLHEQGAAAFSEGKLAVVRWSEVRGIIETQIQHGFRPNALSVAIMVLDRPVFRYVAQLENGVEFAFVPCSEAQTPRLKQLLRHYADQFQWTWKTVVEYQ